MKRILLVIILVLQVLGAWAQCSLTNTAFQSGETLSYDLFYNWKFVWIRAGSATMTTTSTVWQGEPAYRSYLITRTSRQADKYFLMRDTLLSIMRQDMVPLYYRKAANEGGRYYVDQVWYSYSGGKTHLRQQYLSRQGETTHTTYDSQQCVYDMLSMMMRARSLDPATFRNGQRVTFPMADGDEVETATIVYRGKKNFTMDGTNVTYRCMVFSFVENEGGREKEIITFYISDDENHMPLRLDMFLRFGTAKAFLKGYQGLRHPVTSIVSKPKQKTAK